MSAKVEQFFITIDDRRVPLAIHTEKRRNSRVSIGRKGITIRVPGFLPNDKKNEQVKAFTDWAVDKLKEKPDLLPPSVTRVYENGYTFELRGRPYTLWIEKQAGIAGAKAKLANSAFYVVIPSDYTHEETQKAIPALVSRLIARKFHTFMYNRLLELNELYFGKVIKGFKLKYTHSVWGSCSHTGNINISTRLLFAPDDAIDYVLIHELAHLIHPNHSDRFWNEVERVMPDYMVQEKWLKKYGGQCDF